MRIFRRVATGALLVAAALLAAVSCRFSRSPSPGPASTAVDAVRQSLGSAFAPIARVLRHPRCMNCHPTDDRPRVGDGQPRIHAMNVMRGPDNRGFPAMHCSACHQSDNQDSAGVPGAPDWHLAPRSMGWDGLDDHDLATTLVDRDRNGDRSLADLRHHLAEDPLVLWGWEPGAGREPVPMSHQEFMMAFDAWMNAGAPIPPAGTSSTF